MATFDYVTYNPNAGASAPVIQMGSGTAPNPLAIHILSTTEQGYIQGNDPASIVIDATTGAVSANANFWTLRGPHYIKKQIALVEAGYLGAVTSPYPFTTSAGVSSTYAMDSASQFTYSQAFAKYVQNGQALPTNFTIRDANKVPQAFTVADIENLYNGYSNFFQTCNAAFDTLEENIKAATSLSNCQSYVWVTP